jgi:hypothetical protein
VAPGEAQLQARRRRNEGIQAATMLLQGIRVLAARCDVVVANFGPGVLEKRGLDHTSLSPRTQA